MFFSKSAGFYFVDTPFLLNPKRIKFISVDGNPGDHPDIYKDMKTGEHQLIFIQILECLYAKRKLSSKAVSDSYPLGWLYPKSAGLALPEQHHLFHRLKGAGFNSVVIDPAGQIPAIEYDFVFTCGDRFLNYRFNFLPQGVVNIYGYVCRMG